MAMSPLRRWSLLSSVRLIGTTDLRKLDGAAFQLRERNLDLRSATVMSDEGLHLMTIEKLEFEPEDVEGLDLGPLFTPVLSDIEDVPVRKPGQNKYGHMRLLARVYINPGFTPANQVIADYLSISFATWLKGPGQGFGAAMGYLRESGLTEVLGRTLELDVQPERARTPEQRELLHRLLIDLDSDDPDRSSLDQYDETDVPLLIQAERVVNWATYDAQTGAVDGVDGGLIPIHKPYDPSNADAQQLYASFGSVGNMVSTLRRWGTDA